MCHKAVKRCRVRMECLLPGRFSHLAFCKTERRGSKSLRWHSELRTCRVCGWTTKSTPGRWRGRKKAPYIYSTKVDKSISTMTLHAAPHPSLVLADHSKLNATCKVVSSLCIQRDCLHRGNEQAKYIPFKYILTTYCKEKLKHNMS